MDDLFKKLQSMMSGSLTTPKTKEGEAKQSIDPNEDLVNSFMEQILDVAWVEEELKNNVGPSYHLSKKQGSYWLMNINQKILTHVKSGVEIIPIEKGVKNTVCLIGTSTFSVPNDLLVCSGWN